LSPGAKVSETLNFVLAGWIQCRLQFNIERTSPHTAPVHRAEDLNVADGIEAEARGDPGFHQLDDALHGDFGVFRLHKVEIAISSRRAEIGNYALIDAVGGGDDAALSGLPEHLGQSHDWYRARRDYVRQHLARSHGGKLVNIANDQESGGGGHSLYESLHQHDVHHGGFVDHQQVALEWIVIAALEPSRLGVNFEQSVDGFGFKAGRLSHARRGRLEHPAGAARLLLQGSVGCL
jgi:hypothetical protein